MGPCIESSYWPSGAYPRQWREGKAVLVSHIMWEDNYGPIPLGMQINHRCDNARCVRLDHLWLGTQSENIQDAVAKRRDKNSKKTHCPEGHEYTEGNTYVRVRNGGVNRSCRTCVLAKRAEYLVRRKASA